MTHTISQVSCVLSVSTRALRYYEEMGLIHSRRIEGYAYRVYDEDTVRRLLRYLQEKVSVSGSEGWKESVPLLPEDILLPRENSIPPMPSLPQDVRILSLPRPTVAAAHTIKMGDFHEWTALAGWAEQSPDWEIRWACDGTEIMGGSLEEHLNYLQDRAAGRLQTGQLDLLLPIQKGGNLNESEAPLYPAQGRTHFAADRDHDLRL